MKIQYNKNSPWGFTMIFWVMPLIVNLIVYFLLTSGSIEYEEIYLTIIILAFILWFILNFKIEKNK